jgi:hypothetical protein
MKRKRSSAKKKRNSRQRESLFGGSNKDNEFENDESLEAYVEECLGSIANFNKNNKHQL